MMQIPNYVNPYMQPQMQQYATPAPNYNAVKIDVHNPSVNTPGVGQAVVNVPQQPQYAAPTMPYYTYPQAQLYDYPQAQQQPYYMPPQMQAPVAPKAPAAPAPAPVEVPAPQVVAPAPQIVQQNINAPQQAPEAVVTKPAESPKEVKPVEVVPSAPLAPQVDLNGFVAKLTNPDYEVQAATMEEIANMVKEDPQKATELLDVKVMDALNNIVKLDTSKLAEPTAEQLAARKKKDSNQQLTPEELKLADTPSPYEAAERNKSYAMYTLAILQKLYGDEVAKLTNSTVPLTELPGAVTIVEQLKNNPNPTVRTSAVEALSYIQNPAYEKDLQTIFNNAKNDVDGEVQKAANLALEKLANESQNAAGAKTIEMTPNPQPAEQAQGEGKTFAMNPANQAPAQAA